MEDLLKALPDDRPVTGLCIVEDPAKCPPGFQVVDKTFDQDTDADLWKDGFFGKRITRYICISKEQGIGTEVVESIHVVGERDSPPDGFILLLHTHDTEQRATRKKYMCYKLIPMDKVQLAVTDVIVLSKAKKPPPGFNLAGELNSLLICFKVGTVIPTRRHSNGLGMFGVANSPWSTPPPKYHPIPVGGGSVKANNTDTNRTLNATSVIDYIPFDINPKYKDIRHLTDFVLPNIRIKSKQQIESEYSYNFDVEHQAQQAIPSELF